MNSVEIQDLIERQSKAIAILSLRVATLEQILLKKGIISESDVAEQAKKLGEEFMNQTQEAFRKAAKEQQSVK